MMNKRFILSVVTVAALSIFFAGCSSDSSSSSSSSSGIFGSAIKAKLIGATVYADGVEIATTDANGDWSGTTGTATTVTITGG